MFNLILPVAIENEPGSGIPLSPGQFTFTEPLTRIKLDDSKNTEVILWTLHGKWRNGEAIPDGLLRFASQDDPPASGIRWYEAAYDGKNDWMNEGQKRKFEVWIDRHQPFFPPQSEDHVVQVQFKRGDLESIGAHGPNELIHLSYLVLVEATLDADGPWVGATHDPEVDIEME